MQVQTTGCCSPIRDAPLSEADATELAKAFAALADPVRLRLLSLVAAAEETCSCDLMGPLGKSSAKTIGAAGSTPVAVSSGADSEVRIEGSFTTGGSGGVL